jgi:hypothetical protein
MWGWFVGYFCTSSVIEHRTFPWNGVSVGFVVLGEWSVTPMVGGWGSNVSSMRAALVSAWAFAFTACDVFKDVMSVGDGLDSGCVEKGWGLVGGNVVVDDSREHVGGSHVPLVKENLRGL